MRALAAVPDRAAALLADRMRPAEAGPAARLIADLNSDDLETREKASRELLRLGANARSALDITLAQDPPAETRRRIEELLQKIDPVPLPEEARGVRAVDVLERVGTDKARATLKALASGAPSALVTREAKEALDRLAKKTPAKP
jgi:hypothetical protein